MDVIRNAMPFTCYLPATEAQTARPKPAISLAPNPARDVITLVGAPTTSLPTQLTVVNMAGRQFVLVSTGNGSYGVQPLAHGIYALRLPGGAVVRLVKE